MTQGTHHCHTSQITFTMARLAASFALLTLAACLLQSSQVQSISLRVSDLGVCGSSCDHGSIRDAGPCCRSWGFESGFCGPDMELGNGRRNPGIAYCAGGKTMDLIGDCLETNATIRATFAKFYERPHCRDLHEH